ncbi:MAG: hypothetical protein ABR987_08400 [Terracidiphilus sp.]|jgi:hypothetical protein
MTILLELDPETEARLKAQAERRGVAPEQYAGEFLREVLPLYSPGSGRLLPGDVERMTDVMTAGAENLPVLPSEVNERESYYEDRW